MLLVNMKEGGFISAHDFEIGSRIATILCGGEVEPGSVVDEKWLLDLERRHFVALAKTAKSQDRIEAMLKVLDVEGAVARSGTRWPGRW